MKKAFSLLAIASAIFFTSCCNRTDDFSRQNKRTYTAEIIDGTRSTIAEDGDVYRTTWVKGDKIAITDGETTSIYKTQDGGKSKANFSFWGGVDPEGMPVAYYPSTITKEIPTVQSYTKDNIFIPMVGEIVDDHIVFKNLCGMMKLNVSCDKGVAVRRMEISADQPLCGEYYVENGTAIIDDEEGILTIEFDEGLAVSSTPTPVYISLPENTYTGLIFKVTLANRSTCTVSLKRGNSIKIERSKVHEGAIVLKNFKDAPKAPVADLFDIMFNPDGTAQDVSSSGLEIQTIDANSMCSFYDARLGRWVAHFNHAGAISIYSGFYRADYGDEFTTALGESHTLECLISSDILSEGGTEYKMFSTMQSGGTGFLISKTSAATPLQLTFLPYVGSNYVWAGSEVNPEPGRYYHLVGIYDKKNELVSVYLDGELVGEYDAVGDFKPASAAARWICVGGDSSNTAVMQNGWKGVVAIARAYSAALTEDQVKALYQASHVGHDYSNFFAYKSISFSATEPFSAGDEFTVFADGIEPGDFICFEAQTEENKLITCTTTYDIGTLKAIIPAGLTSGIYRIWACRDEQKYALGKAELTIL